MPVNSMTAFAREADDASQGSLVVEIRSVNHRYLDCVFKLPEQLRGLEPALRQQTQAALARGKLEVQMRWQAQPGLSDALQVNPQRLTQLAEAMQVVSESVPTSQTPTTLEILQWPGVVAAAGDDADSINTLAASVFQRALQTLQETRAREGEKMSQLILERLQQVGEEVRAARSRMPELLAQQRQRLETRLAELDIEVEPGRVEQELVMLAQKADVEEELDRLEAHVQEVERVLAKGGPCGRRLDFLMQELNREANTLSSKSISGSTTQNAVELKVLIEQMREQIQNLE
ncbi:MAG: YicC/YloC family endoribonuclease [Halieaceae bacterium]